MAWNPQQGQPFNYGSWLQGMLGGNQQMQQPQPGPPGQPMNFNPNGGIPGTPGPGGMPGWLNSGQAIGPAQNAQPVGGGLGGSLQTGQMQNWGTSPGIGQIQSSFGPAPAPAWNGNTGDSAFYGPGVGGGNAPQPQQMTGGGFPGGLHPIIQQLLGQMMNGQQGGQFQGAANRAMPNQQPRQFGQGGGYRTLGAMAGGPRY